MNTESRAKTYAAILAARIREEGGIFLRRNGSYNLLLGGSQISLDFDPGNIALAGLLVKYLDVGSLSSVARLTIQRLQIQAADEAQKCNYSDFSTIQDGSVYISLDPTTLVVVTPETIATVPNGSTFPDSAGSRVFIGHTSDWSLRPADIHADNASDGFDHFVRLLVEPQASTHPDLSWLVAMHCAIAPYVRQKVAARSILLLQGKTGSGKTTGASLFARFLGIPHVVGDYSVAALNRFPHPLMVIDNKEQQDVTAEMSNFLIYAATGGGWARSDRNGAVSVSTTIDRPLTVVTSIEGFCRHELVRRCLVVPYDVNGPHCGVDHFLYAITANRPSLFNAVLRVIQTFLRLPTATWPSPSPTFSDYYSLLCNLIHAYGIASHRAPDWHLGIIKTWSKLLSVREIEQDQVEYAVLTALFSSKSRASHRETVHNGTSGLLFTVESAELLQTIRAQSGAPSDLPLSPSGLRRRLNSIPLSDIRILTHQDEPELRRTAHNRPFGIFVPEEVVHRWTRVPQRIRISRPGFHRISDQQRNTHRALPASECYYLWDWKPGTSGESFELLSALKGLGSPDTSGALARTSAIDFCAQTLRDSIPARLTDGDVVWTSMPSTSAFDDRLRAILAQIPEVSHTDLLRCDILTAQRQKGISAQMRAQTMSVIHVERSLRCIVVLDDVVSGGSHFAAAHALLSKQYPECSIVGVFLFRRVLEQSCSLAHVAGRP